MLARPEPDRDGLEALARVEEDNLFLVHSLNRGFGHHNRGAVFSEREFRVDE